MTDYLVKASALVGFRKTMEALGGETDPLLRRAGLSGRDQDPEAWISYRSFLQLLEDASQVTRCPYFGLTLAQNQDIDILGAVGFVMQQAPDLRTALRELATYFAHHNQGGFVSITVQEGIAQWSFICKLEGDAPTRQQLDLVAGLGLNVMRLLWRPDWHPNALYVAHTPPADTNIYRKRFGCPVFFNSDSTVMTFDAAILDAPISKANQNLHRVLEDYLSNLQLAFADDYCGRIRYVIKQAMITGDCSIERVAKFLAVNKRTLQRQLSAQNTSYKDLLQEVRFDTARQYLRESSGSLTILTDMLGYSDLSTFSNAFRKRFGKSPREWRKQQTHDGALPT